MPEFAGSFTTINLAEVMRMLSGTHQTGVLHLDLGTDHGTLSMESGQFLNAATGALTGAPALYQFILWREAEFRFDEEPIPPEANRELAQFDTQTLINGVAKKIDELAALQQAIPSLDSVLFYLGGESLGDVEATPSELGLLILADGKRTVSEIADKARLNPLEVARSLAKFRLAGALELVENVVPGNPEPGATEAAPPPVPEPEPDAAPPPPPPTGSEPVRYWRGKRVN
ncbi:MAG: DUF4388 domain-containing protein [Verrucomicrobiota bacterium]